MKEGAQAGVKSAARKIVIRRATVEDLPAIVRLDEKTTGKPKPQHWEQLLAHFSEQSGGRAFLVAAIDDRVIGFMTGEVRAFEFGSEPCGWVFALTVDPQVRVQNVGTQLFEALCEVFKEAGVDKVRTMLARENHLVLAFFRSLGMMAGPFIQLERDLE
ncbi:MAG: GNAT family N-acetyltransferase [Xanthobacteraceae bacterium]|nr:MAG: GNAT family N-acetyltransferase [Xanthobacteraceae bacterium]